MSKREFEKDPRAFWQIRAANYDKLYWTRDQNYLSEIIRLADLKEHHLALDVGTGTGTVGAAISGLVRHVVAVDISNAMLEKGSWSGISVVKWDIGESLFADCTFDRVFARMVFHHILDNLDRAILRCYDVLKEGGKIIVAEGIPPLSDPDVVEWYTEMFRLKEERRTFTQEMLVHYLAKNGFRNVKTHSYYMEKFSIANWLENSGLSENIRAEIMNMHRNAPEKIKRVYNMRLSGNECTITTRNVIIVAERISTGTTEGQSAPVSSSQL